MLARVWLCWVPLLLLARPAQPCPAGCDCFAHKVFCSAPPPDIPPHATDLVFVEAVLPTVVPRAFSGSPNLTKVVFLNTRLHSLGPDAFGGLPRLEDLEITGSNLSLAGDTFSNLSSLAKLTLNFDGLETLPEGLFCGLAGLELLELQGNQLRTLHPRIFQPLRALRTLNLAQNLLGYLPEGLLSPLTSLESLRLSGNRLSLGPEPGALRSLGSLRELFLDGNAISRLSPGAFSGLLRLERLGLQHNAISHLPLSAFSDLGRLTSLNLQGNALHWLPAGLLAPTPRLQSLSLSHNRLQGIAEGALANLSHLASLTLSHNAISHLPAGAFRDLTGLVVLYLGHNNLTALPPSLFQNLSRLELLNLSRNQLAMLPETIFDTNYDLFNLVLYGNPWHCDCHLAYLARWLRQYGDLLFHSHTYCASPASLRGRPVLALREEQFVCPTALGPLPFQGLEEGDRVPGNSWHPGAQERAAQSWCTFSNPEGTVVLACGGLQCHWLNIQLSPGQGSGYLAMSYNASQEWDLASSCGSVRVTVSIRAQAARP
ncbi:carboxypeptidase N subunit 2 [Ctenodactylus gundi]